LECRGSMPLCSVGAGFSPSLVPPRLLWHSPRSCRGTTCCARPRPLFGKWAATNRCRRVPHPCEFQGAGFDFAFFLLSLASANSVQPASATVQPQISPFHCLILDYMIPAMLSFPVFAKTRHRPAPRLGPSLFHHPLCFQAIAHSFAPGRTATLLQSVHYALFPSSWGVCTPLPTLLGEPQHPVPRRSCTLELLIEDPNPVRTRAGTPYASPRRSHLPVFPTSAFPSIPILHRDSTATC
jgi:hypothetical protein